MLESCYVSPHSLLSWGGRFQKLKIYMLEYAKDVHLHTCISGAGQAWEKLTMRMWVHNVLGAVSSTTETNSDGTHLWFQRSETQRQEN